MRILRFLSPVLLTALAFVLGSEAYAAADVVEIVPPVVPNKAAIDVSTRPITRTAEFTAWRVNLDPVDLIGTGHEGVFCSAAEERRYYPKLGDWFMVNTRDSFTQQMIKAGYPRHKQGESAFENKLGEDADFKVGATLMDLKYSVCGRGSEIKGAAYIKMKWELFSALRQKVVYTKIVEAYFDNKSGKETAFDDFFRKMLDREVDNLLSDPDFVTVQETGGGDKTGTVDLPVLALKSRAQAKLEVAASSAQLQSAVVTVESGGASGSGFFISDDGYVLTNEHVVGGAKFVKLRLTEGKSLVGQVVRIDSIRDVALIKTEAPQITPLSIRKTLPVTGEVVYAIGSPFGQTLAGSLTRGVLSSRRTLEGVTYLQSDVSVTHGSSGGPLIDSTGGVIGLTQSGMGQSGNVNLFIPIDEALERLGLTVN